MLTFPIGLLASKAKPFKFSIDTSLGIGNTFTLPLNSSYNYDFYWTPFVGATPIHITAYDDTGITYDYGVPFAGEVSINGLCESFYFNNVGDRLKLTEIIQWGNIGAITAISAFYGCINLDTIPDSSITWDLVNTFNSTFRSCISLPNIPTDLFKLCPLVLSSGFNLTFLSCSGLTGSIPTDLFRYNTLNTIFNQTFRNCSGLTGSIPVDLFRYCPNVISFAAVFQNCSGLTGSIPADLFRYNTLVTTFASAFFTCSGLTGNIPENLFYYNTLVTSYFRTLYRCRSLVLPSVLFNLSNLSIVTTWEQFAEVLSTIYSLTGTIQDIWNYSTGTSLNAFLKDESITNYADIPDSWKGL